MEKIEVEYSDKRETRGYAHEFVKRLNEAKRKGFKITGSVNETELRNFELSGNQTRTVPEVKNEKRSCELTAEDRKRISKRLRDDAELEQYRKDMQPERDQRRKTIENELKLKKIGLTLIPEKIDNTTLFIQPCQKSKDTQ